MTNGRGKPLPFLMSIFSDQFKLASEAFLTAVKELIEVNGQPIEASVDPVTFKDSIRSGGRTAGVEFVIHVRKSDWAAVGGAEGSKILASGKKARAKSFTDISDDQYEVICESFKGTSGL